MAQEAKQGRSLRMTLRKEAQAIKERNRVPGDLYYKEPAGAKAVKQEMSMQQDPTRKRVKCTAIGELLVSLTGEEGAEVEIALAGFEEFNISISTREEAIKDLREIADWLERQA